MTLYDQGVESLTPGKLINPKALTTVVRDFFARSQLSQFKDQINPLAELLTNDACRRWARRSEQRERDSKCGRPSHSLWSHLPD